MEYTNILRENFAGDVSANIITSQFFWWSNHWRKNPPWNILFSTLGYEISGLPLLFDFLRTPPPLAYRFSAFWFSDQFYLSSNRNISYFWKAFIRTIFRPLSRLLRPPPTYFSDENCQPPALIMTPPARARAIISYARIKTFRDSKCAWQKTFMVEIFAFIFFVQPRCGVDPWWCV